jgi:Glycosyltransferase Family 4/Glycosyl transferases group 1
LIKICFAVPHGYALFDESSREVFGGAEVRARLLAGALARNGDLRVSFVAIHEKPVECEQFGAIEVWREPSCAAQSRLRRAARAIRSRLQPGFLSARARVFAAVDADVYAVFGTSDYAAELATFCRSRSKKFVLFVSSGYDLSDAYRPESKERNVYGSRQDLCYYALIQADLIIAQTVAQQQKLREAFGRESIVIPNPVDLAAMAPILDRASRKYVLWIGKADRVKGAEPLLRLANAFPKLSFLMVLNRSDPAIFDRITSALPANVEILEFVPYARSDELFRHALAFVNTSIFEGFPNTFLQAGKFGVPVISLNVDLDGFLAQHGCGIHAAGEFDRLVQGLALLQNDPAAWHNYSERILARVRAHHDLESLGDLVRRALMSVVGIGELAE